MAKHHGKNGIVLVTIAGGPAAPGEIKKYTIETSAETIDANVLSSEWDEHVPGLKSWSGTIEAHFDAADPVQEVLVEGVVVTIDIKPEGDEEGAFFVDGSATVVSCSIVNENAAIVAYNISIKGTEELYRNEYPSPD